MVIIKKKVKKVVAKKTSIQMPSRKNKGKESKHMVNASEAQCFWVYNGPTLANLKDLSNALKKLSKDQFNYHANTTKNDFASWVEFVLMDPECAQGLKKCKNKASAQACTVKALKKYK